MLPAAPAYVTLYLLSVLQASTSPSPIQSALYSIRWAHDVAGLESPTSHNLPQKDLRVSQAEAVPPDIQKIVYDKGDFCSSFSGALGDRSLVDTRLMAIDLLTLAEFMRFDELSSLELKGVVSHATYFELFVECSKTDQYRQGTVAPIVKTGTDHCPWANLLKNCLRQSPLCPHLLRRRWLPLG